MTEEIIAEILHEELPVHAEEEEQEGQDSIREKQEQDSIREKQEEEPAHVQEDPRQKKLEDLFLTKILPCCKSNEDLLASLRAYVAEVVRCEVITSLITGSSQMLQAMVKFHVSKQLKEGAFVEEAVETILDDQDFRGRVCDLASEAGCSSAYDAASESVNELYREMMSKSDVEVIASKVFSDEVDEIETKIREDLNDDLRQYLRGEVLEIVETHEIYWHRRSYEPCSSRKVLEESLEIHG